MVAKVRTAEWARYAVRHGGVPSWVAQGVQLQGSAPGFRVGVGLFLVRWGRLGDLPFLDQPRPHVGAGTGRVLIRRPPTAQVCRAALP